MLVVSLSLLPGPLSLSYSCIECGIKAPQPSGSLVFSLTISFSSYEASFFVFVFTKYFICIKFIHMHCSGEGKSFLVSICQGLQTSLSPRISPRALWDGISIDNKLLTGVGTGFNRNTLAMDIISCFRLVVGHISPSVRGAGGASLEVPRLLMPFSPRVFMA